MAECSFRPSLVSKQQPKSTTHSEQNINIYDKLHNEYRQIKNKKDKLRQASNERTKEELTFSPQLYHSAQFSGEEPGSTQQHSD